jgi:hypothetical protein
MLTTTEIAGFIGAGLAGTAYVPQISHLIRARCAAGISRLASCPSHPSGQPTAPGIGIRGNEPGSWRPAGRTESQATHLKGTT